MLENRTHIGLNKHTGMLICSEKNEITVPTKARFCFRRSDTATEGGTPTYIHAHARAHTYTLSYLAGLWRKHLPGFPQVFAWLKALHMNT